MVLRMFVRRCVSVCVLGLLLGACGAEEPPVDDSPLPPPGLGEGFQLSATTTAPAGEEVWRCVVYDAPNDQWEMVNRVESIQNDAMHHMNVVALSLTDVSLEPGDYDCNALYEEHPELMDAMIIYASQAETQNLTLPSGVGANLPPNIRIMHEMHLVNTTEQDLDVFSYINAYSADPTTIEETIWGGGVRDLNLNIPANAEHSEWTRCVMNEPVDIVFLSSHTHALGVEVSIRLFDGDEVGEQVYVNHDWHSPYLKSFAELPLHIPAGTGFEFTCKFNNPFDEPITYGFAAADEMCTMAMVFTPGQASRTCSPVSSSDGVL